MAMVRPRNSFAVICHGDLWLSNILFRYVREEPATATTGAATASGAAGDAAAAAAAAAAASQQQQQQSESVRPSEVKFLDFQSARFASLATDLILFLFTSVKVRLVS